MSEIKGQNIEVELKDDYLSEYYNGKNNPNNLGTLVKLLYTKYNSFIVNEGKGLLKYY